MQEGGLVPEFEPPESGEVSDLLGSLSDYTLPSEAESTASVIPWGLDSSNSISQETIDVVGVDPKFPELNFDFNQLNLDVKDFNERSKNLKKPEPMYVPSLLTGEKSLRYSEKQVEDYENQAEALQSEALTLQDRVKDADDVRSNFKTEEEELNVQSTSFLQEARRTATADSWNIILENSKNKGEWDFSAYVPQKSNVPFTLPDGKETSYGNIAPDMYEHVSIQKLEPIFATLDEEREKTTLYKSELFPGVEGYGKEFEEVFEYEKNVLRGPFSVDKNSIKELWDKAEKTTVKNRERAATEVFYKQQLEKLSIDTSKMSKDEERDYFEKLERQFFITTASEAMTTQMSDDEKDFRYGKESQGGIRAIRVDLTGDGFSGKDKGWWHDGSLMAEVTALNGLTATKSVYAAMEEGLANIVGKGFDIIGAEGAANWAYKEADRALVNSIELRDKLTLKKLEAALQKTQVAFTRAELAGFQDFTLEEVDDMVDMEITRGLLGGPDFRTIRSLEMAPGFESLFPTAVSMLAGTAAAAASSFTGPGALAVGATTTMGVMHALVSAETYNNMYDIDADTGEAVLADEFKGMNRWGRLGYVQGMAASESIGEGAQYLLLLGPLKILKASRFGAYASKETFKRIGNYLAGASIASGTGFIGEQAAEGTTGYVGDLIQQTLVEGVSWENINWDRAFERAMQDARVGRWMGLGMGLGGVTIQNTQAMYERAFNSSKFAEKANHHATMQFLNSSALTEGLTTSNKKTMMEEISQLSGNFTQPTNKDKQILERLKAMDITIQADNKELKDLFTSISKLRPDVAANMLIQDNLIKHFDHIIETETNEAAIEKAKKDRAKAMSNFNKLYNVGRSAMDGSPMVYTVNANGIDTETSHSRTPKGNPVNENTAENDWGGTESHTGSSFDGPLVKGGGLVIEGENTSGDVDTYAKESGAEEGVIQKIIDKAKQLSENSGGKLKVIFHTNNSWKKASPKMGLNKSDQGGYVLRKDGSQEIHLTTNVSSMSDFNKVLVHEFGHSAMTQLSFNESWVDSTFNTLREKAYEKNKDGSYKNKKFAQKIAEFDIAYKDFTGQHGYKLELINEFLEGVSTGEIKAKDLGGYNAVFEAMVAEESFKAYFPWADKQLELVEEDSFIRMAAKFTAVERSLNRKGKLRLKSGVSQNTLNAHMSSVNARKITGEEKAEEERLEKVGESIQMLMNLQSGSNALPSRGDNVNGMEVFVTSKEDNISLSAVVDNYEHFTDWYNTVSSNGKKKFDSVQFFGEDGSLYNLTPPSPQLDKEGNPIEVPTYHLSEYDRNLEAMANNNEDVEEKEMMESLPKVLSEADMDGIILDVLPQRVLDHLSIMHPYTLTGQALPSRTTAKDPNPNMDFSQGPITIYYTQNIIAESRGTYKAISIEKDKSGKEIKNRASYFPITSKKHLANWYAGKTGNSEAKVAISNMYYMKGGTETKINPPSIVLGTDGRPVQKKFPTTIGSLKVKKNIKIARDTDSLIKKKDDLARQMKDLWYDADKKLHHHTNSNDFLPVEKEIGIPTSYASDTQIEDDIENYTIGIANIQALIDSPLQKSDLEAIAGGSTEYISKEANPEIFNMSGLQKYEEGVSDLVSAVMAANMTAEEVSETVARINNISKPTEGEITFEGVSRVSDITKGLPLRDRHKSGKIRAERFGNEKNREGLNKITKFNADTGFGSTIDSPTIQEGVIQAIMSHFGVSREQAKGFSVITKSVPIATLSSGNLKLKNGNTVRVTGGPLGNAVDHSDLERSIRKQHRNKTEEQIDDYVRNGIGKASLMSFTTFKRARSGLEGLVQIAENEKKNLDQESVPIVYLWQALTKSNVFRDPGVFNQLMNQYVLEGIENFSDSKIEQAINAVLKKTKSIDLHYITPESKKAYDNWAEAINEERGSTELKVLEKQEENRIEAMEEGKEKEEAKELFRLRRGFEKDKASVSSLANSLNAEFSLEANGIITRREGGRYTLNEGKARDFVLALTNRESSNKLTFAERQDVMQTLIGKLNKIDSEKFESQEELEALLNDPLFEDAQKGDLVAATMAPNPEEISPTFYGQASNEQNEIRNKLEDRSYPYALSGGRYTILPQTFQNTETLTLSGKPAADFSAGAPARRKLVSSLPARRLPGRIYMQGNSSWEKSTPTKYGAKLERFALRLQDKYSNVMLLQQDIEVFRRDSGKYMNTKVPQSQDFEMAMDNMYGMLRTDFERLENEMEKIDVLMEKSGLTAEQVSDYLYAKHAPERNDYIKSKRFEMLSGSGMTTEDAEAIINELETPEMIAVSKLVYGILANTRKTMVEGGLEKASTIETYEGLFKYYVPLNGLAQDEMDNNDKIQNPHPTGGAGMAIYGRSTRAAKGRASKTGINLIANVIMQNAATKQRARKDQAMLALYNLVKNNPNLKVWDVYSSRKPRMKVGKDGKSVGMNVLEMQAMDNMVPLRINGEQHFIYFKKVDYANALNGETAERVSFIASKYQGLLGFMRNSYTQYNPGFFVGNFFRDLGGAVFNSLSEVEREGGIMQGYGINSKKFTKDIIFGSFTSLRALLNDSALGREMNKEMKEYLIEWEAAGGRTGYSYSETINNVMEDMRSRAETKSGFKTAKDIIFKKPKDFFKYIAAINEAFENSIRLSAYIEARKVGVTKQRAAQLSKNITINFNKSGELTPALNSMYLFFNASVQGATRFGRTFQQGKFEPAPPLQTHEETKESIPDNPDETPQWKNRISSAQKLAAGHVLVSALVTMVNIALSDREDDDELSYNKIAEYKKERGFNIMYNGKNYFSVPLGYGFNMFHIAGMLLAEVATGQREVDDAAMFMALSSHSSFSPIAFGHSETVGGSIGKGLMPSVGKAWMDAFAFNETYFGGQVYREQLPFGVEVPKYTLSFRSPEFIQQATKALSDMTEGTENIDGGVDWNADPYYYIMQSYWGGAGDFVEETGGLTRAGVEMARKKYNKLASARTTDEFVDNLFSTPEEDRPLVKFSDVPILKTIYGGPSRFYDFDLFDKNRKEVEQYFEELKDAKDGKLVPGFVDFEGVKKLKEKLKDAEEALRVVWDARKKVKEIEDFIDRSNATYMIQEAERQVVMGFNKDYYDLRGQYVDPKPEGIIPMDKIRKAIGTDE